MILRVGVEHARPFQLAAISACLAEGSSVLDPYNSLDSPKRLSSSITASDNTRRGVSLCECYWLSWRCWRLPLGARTGRSGEVRWGPGYQAKRDCRGNGA